MANSSKSDRDFALIIADDPDCVAAMGAHMLRHGFDVDVAYVDDAQIRNVPACRPDVIVLALAVKRSNIAQIARRCRSVWPGVKILGAVPVPNDVKSEAVDSVIALDAHPAQITNRAHAMVRLMAMEDEIIRRRDALSQGFGKTTDLAGLQSDIPFKILFIGKATPEFMVVLNALSDRNAELKAAFTSFTAFDYLHAKDFDCVVLNAMESEEPAASIASVMRTNRRLYHVPALFLTGPGIDIAGHDTFKRGLRDIVRGGESVEVIGARIIELANFHRLHKRLAHLFAHLRDADCTDEESGLLDRRFLQAYLKTDGPDTAHLFMRLRPSSETPPDSTFLQLALAQAGGMIAGAVRMQDLVTRILDDVICITVAKQNRPTLERIRTRVEALLDAAAFATGTDASPLTFSVDATLSTPLPHESAEMIIKNGLSELGETMSLSA